MHINLKNTADRMALVVATLLTLAFTGLIHAQAPCWAPAQSKCYWFPEVEIDGVIHKEVPVHFYTTTADFKPVGAEWWKWLEEDRAANVIDQGILPMVKRLGFLIVMDPNEEGDSKLWLISIEENNVITMAKAAGQGVETKIYQPLYGDGSEIVSFSSERLSKVFLGLMGIPIKKSK
jgi:hypothetical protein